MAPRGGYFSQRRPCQETEEAARPVRGVETWAEGRTVGASRLASPCYTLGATKALQGQEALQEQEAACEFWLCLLATDQSEVGLGYKAL